MIELNLVIDDLKEHCYVLKSESNLYSGFASTTFFGKFGFVEIMEEFNKRQKTILTYE